MPGSREFNPIGRPVFEDIPALRRTLEAREAARKQAADVEGGFEHQEAHTSLAVKQ